MQKIQALLILTLALLAGCATKPASEAPVVCPACAPCTSCPPPVVAPVPPAAPAAFSRTLVAGAWEDLPGWKDDDLAAAWAPFLNSCRGMASHPHGPAWKRVCELARAVDGRSTAAVRGFFEQHLRPYAVQAADGTGSGMFTGYYEPLLRGSRQRTKGYEQPLRAVPDDLLTIDLAALFPELKDKRVRGRLEGNKVVPYWTRAELARRGDRAPGRTLLYVDDAIELFFLQVQGSGRVQLTDGSIVRVNYADQNGHPYQSIGRLLVERGELKLEDASMQGIQAWARANPARLDELLDSNPSYVFFRELPNSKDGPIGALGVPLTPERSLAIDPRSIPLGAPVFLATTRPNSNQPLNRLMLAQDTGGAIKGAVRGDFFWGFGKAAGELAGRMKQNGRFWVLLPPEAVVK